MGTTVGTIQRVATADLGVDGGVICLEEFFDQTMRLQMHKEALLRLS